MNMENLDGGVNWDFNAPTFVDFGNDEHEKSTGTDEYFNHDHESMRTSSLSDKSATEFGFVNQLMDDQNNNMRQTFENVEKMPIADDIIQSSDEMCESNTLNNNTDMKEVSCMETNISDNSSEKRLPVQVDSDVFVEDSVKDVCAPTIKDSVSPPKSFSGDSFNAADKAHNQTECSVKIVELQNKDFESASQVKALPKTPVLPNIITPGRVASWERYRQQRRSCAPSSSVLSKDRRSKQLKKLNELRSNGGNSNPSNPPPSKKKKKNNRVQLMEPVTPTVLKHARHFSAPKQKSSEEIELDEIQDLKYRAKQATEESSKSFKQALKTPVVNNINITSTAKPTKVEEFKFKTDKRIRSHTMDTRSRKLSSEIDFTKGLRQHPPSPKKLKKTVVKPFNLSSSRKRKIEAETKKDYDFVPMAKAVMSFQKGSRVQNAQSTKSRKGPMKAKPGLTVAKTPKLESRMRTRGISVISAKELEDQEVEEMKSYHFKAKPVNREILEHADTLPEVKKASSTKPIGFDLEIDKRIDERPKHDEVTCSTREFKAQPIPKKILEGVVGVMKPEIAPPTVPRSPAFALKNRMQLAQIRKENKENLEHDVRVKEEQSAKNDLPTNTKKAPKPKVSLEKTEIKPFSFDTRDKERFAKKEERIKNIIESEKAIHSQFRATPICEPGRMVKTASSKRKITDPKPFNLRSDERGISKVQKWKQEVEDDMRVLREKAEFKANTNYTKVIYGEAFKPIIEKKVTEFEEFSLHTNERAMKREEFDGWMKQREADIQANQEKQEQHREEIEREEIEKLRKEAEHRANPIRKYKPVSITGSMKELTKPQSPHFSDRFYKK